MDPERKSELKRNFIKFCIGLLLLWLCYVYIQKNPAEKVSIFSWFEVIYQKIQIVVRNVLWENWELLKRKYSLEKYYKELISTAEDKKCIDVETLNKLIHEYENLKRESVDTLVDNLPYYSRSSYQYEAKIEEWCWEQIQF